MLQNALWMDMWKAYTLICLIHILKSGLQSHTTYTIYMLNSSTKMAHLNKCLISWLNHPAQNRKAPNVVVVSCWMAPTQVLYLSIFLVQINTILCANHCWRIRINFLCCKKCAIVSAFAASVHCDKTN